MLNQKQQFGKESESLAVKYLKKKGYKILEENFRTNLGEIDIIAKDKDTVVFVEVKARKTDLFGAPTLSVTHSKQKKISMVALSYLKKKKMMDTRARFDVVSITYEEQKPKIEIIVNAFDDAYDT